jgi:hypothetical protein
MITATPQLYLLPPVVDFEPVATPTVGRKTTAASVPALWHRDAVRIGWLILTLGAVLRIARWWQQRSLWVDELSVSFSIIHRSWHDLLFKELAYKQAAPVGFLVAEKLCHSIGGSTEWALRLPSLIAGLIALPIFMGIVRRVLSPRAGLMALALFAIVSGLTYYSQEVKQYSFDVTVALAITYTAIRLWDDGFTVWRVAAYGIAGGVGMFCSHPALFVAAATLVSLTVGQAYKDSKHEMPAKQWLSLATVSGVWIVLFMVNYVAFLHILAYGVINTVLLRFWENAGGFMPTHPPYLPWIWHSFFKIVHDPWNMGIESADLAMLCALVGLTMLWKHRRMAVVLMLAPIFLAMLASMLRMYPFGDRLVLWTVPVLVILIAAGIDRVWGNGNGLRIALSILVAVMIGGAAFTHALGQAIHESESGREETRPVYQWVGARWQRGDVLYLYHSAWMSFYHYAGMKGVGLDGLKPLQMRVPSDGFAYPAESPGYPTERDEYRAAAGPPMGQDKGYFIVQADHHSADFVSYGDEIENLKTPRPDWQWPTPRRVWVVFAHVWRDNGIDEEKYTVAELDRRARRLMAQPFRTEGASVYLYDMSLPPTSQGGQVTAGPSPRSCASAAGCRTPTARPAGTRR